MNAGTMEASLTSLSKSFCYDADVSPMCYKNISKIKENYFTNVGVTGLTQKRCIEEIKVCHLLGQGPKIKKARWNQGQKTDTKNQAAEWMVVDKTRNSIVCDGERGRIERKW